MASMLGPAATANRRFRRPRRALLAPAAAAIAAVLLVSGCGGSPEPGVAQVASADGSTTGSPSSSGSSAGDPTAYSACMRKNGVPEFPDPDSQGRIKITSGMNANGERTGVDPSSPQFQSAQKACQKLQPKGGKPDAQAQAREATRALAFAKCMRTHGVPAFADPEIIPGGGIKQEIGREAGVDPAAPQFQAAQQACQKLVPGGPMIAAGPAGEKR
jgi:hypothetical protein